MSMHLRCFLAGLLGFIALSLLTGTVVGLVTYLLSWAILELLFGD